MKLEVKDIPQKLLALSTHLRRYLVVIFFIAATLLSVFLIQSINTITQQEPNEEAIIEKASSNKLKIDQASVNKLKALQQTDAGQAVPANTRQNPFSE